MTANLIPMPVPHFHTAAGGLAEGYKLYFFESGTSTLKGTWADSGQVAANTNPVALDARGECTVFLSPGLYTVELRDADENVIWSKDDISGSGVLTTQNSGTNLLDNPSFETDTNADGLPDSWDITEYDSSSTVATVTTDQIHGAKGLKFTSTGLGGGTAMSSSFFELSPKRTYLYSFTLLSSVVDVRNVAEVLYYDSDQAYISSQTVYDEAAANPLTMSLKSYEMTIPATARYAKVKITGCHSSDATPGYTVFDDISVQEINHSTGTTTSTWTINTLGFKGILDPSANTATRTYTLPDRTGTVAMADELYYMRNRAGIINGDMNIWQAGTTFTSIASGGYSADMWSCGYNGAVVMDIKRSTDVPTAAECGNHLAYSLHCDITTADAAIAAGDYFHMIQKVEGYNAHIFDGQSAVLSFWVKSTKTGTFCVSVRNAGTDRSYVAEYTVSTTNTWERKTITIPFNYSGGTWDWTNGIGLFLGWTLAAGTTYHTTAGAWQTGNYFATSNQVNALDNAANDFRLAMVRLVPGVEDTVYIPQRTFQEELALCRRYYWKSFNYATAPASAGGTGAGDIVFPATIAGAVNNFGCYVSFPVQMRTNSPTFTTYNPVAAGTQIYDAIAAGSFTGTTIGYYSDAGFSFYGTGNAATAVGNQCSLHVVAAARL